LGTAATSKSLKLNWDYKSDKELLYAGRNVETFEKAVSLFAEPAHIRSLLRVYVPKGTAHRTTNLIFEKVYKCTHTKVHNSFS